MKIRLDNFNYRGMHFDKYELNLPELGDVYDRCLDKVIIEKIKEDLDKRFWNEVNYRT